jgi:RHS repeat-associated protein
VKFPGNSPAQPIIDNIKYNANSQKVLLKNGNGITTFYRYEATTQRLISIQSTRYSNNNTAEKVQDIEYYYDPVGNITRTLDNSVEVIFNKNKRVDPLADYTCNAIYQLVTATGRQHTGITASTYQNNSTDSFKQCIFGPPPFISDSDKLENYTENYTYDDSGNLISIRHTASSGNSWTRSLPAAYSSNRLQNGNYDGSGNLRNLDISNNVDLAFNCCENLVRAGIILRENQPDDCDYYLYDIDDLRTRKVSEKMAHGGMLTTVEDKIYIGNFELKRNINVDSGGQRTIVSERHTLRVMNNDRCICVIYYTSTATAHPQMEGLRQCRFQLDNNIGSLCMEMDATGQLISYEEYFPYGGTSIITGENETEVKQKEYRYSGKECDDTTGLYYYGRRYYVPWQCRWLNPDPAGTVDGLNLYAFTGGNPVVYADQLGLKKVLPEADDPRPKQPASPTGNDFTSISKNKRKNYFSQPPTAAQEKHYFEDTRSVSSVLKFDGREVLYATNYAPESHLEFPFSGLYNQKGIKIGAHSEDWSTAGFKQKMEDPGFAKSTKKLPADQVKKHVVSMRINFSPCTGCVRTLINFHYYLKKTFGGKTIFRVKFLRPYDLPKTAKKTDTSKSRAFRSTIRTLKNEGIYVRLQPDFIKGKKGYDMNKYNRHSVVIHAAPYITDLKKTWRQLNAHRKK